MGMTKPESNLTEAATTALYNVGTRRQGTPLPPMTSPAVRAELAAAGLIGPLGGLTAAGSGAYSRVCEAKMNAALGEW